MSHHLPIPSANQSVGENVADIAELGLASHYLSLQAQGRTNNGHLFSSVPPSDPAYVTGNLGGMVMIHYLLMPIVGICTIPILVLGLIPAGMLFGAFYLCGTAFSHTGQTVLEAVGAAVAIGAYCYVVVWQIVCRKILWSLVKALF